MQDDRLAGRHVVVTGGVQGIARRVPKASADVAEEGSVVDGVATADDEIGPIYGLAVNAGTQRAVPVRETSVEE